MTVHIQVHDAPQYIATLTGLISPARCRAEIEATEALGYAEAPVTIGHNEFAMLPQLRNNTRVMIDDTERAAWLWSLLGPHLPDGPGGAWRFVGLNERLRYYRYTPGQKFDWHLDGAFVRSADERSLLTVLFYLNGDFEGGETRFRFDDGRQLEVAPSCGGALVFAHPLMHQGAPVSSGVKYVMRSDVMMRRV